MSDEDIADANILILQKRGVPLNSETISMLKKHFLSNTDLIRNRSNTPEKKEYFQKEIKAMLNNSLGILSLSIDPINYLMWSHYANCHKGFCIGFNLLKLASIIDIQYPLLINYQEEIPTWHIKEGEEEYAKKYLGTKGLLWKYEQEIRFMSKKYINKAIKFDIDIIEEIFVGYQMDENHINQICQFYSKNHPKCPIYKVHFAPNKYDLEGKRIN